MNIGVKLSALILSAFLIGCSAPNSTLIPTSTPIINVAEHLAAEIDVIAKSGYVQLTNTIDHALNARYAIVWYDKNGVTQVIGDDDNIAQYKIHLSPKQQYRIELTKPTIDSVNYRFYLD